MKLTFAEIRSLTHGADHITEESDGLHFYKCTAKQEAAWEATGMDRFRVHATTGIRLEVETDANAITFEAPSGNKFEVWINGMFYRQILVNDLRETGKTPVVQLEPGIKRIMFALPSHSAGVLSSFSLDGATFFRPVGYEKKMLFIGDSITQGWDSQFDTLSFAYRTATALGVDFHICGIGGARYIPETFDRVSFDPDTVVIAYGINDFDSTHRTVAENIENINAYLDLVKETYGDRRVVVITPIWMAKKDAEWNRTMRTSIANVAIQKGFEIVDGETLFPKNEAFFADGYLHPNDLGFSVYAERLIAYFRKNSNR